MPNKKENISLDEAQRIAKREGAIRAVESVYDAKKYIAFLDKNSLLIAEYCEEDKQLFVSTKKERSERKESVKRGDLERQKDRAIRKLGTLYEKKYRNYLTHEGIFRQRFPDRKGLEEIEIKIDDLKRLGGGVGRYLCGSKKHKPKIILSDKLKKGTPSYAYVLTHELVHHIRRKDNRWEKQDLNEETETELESSCRGNIIDLKAGGQGYYDNMDYDKAVQDYRLLMNQNPPVVYPELRVPLTNKIIREIDSKRNKTFLYKDFSESKFFNEDIDTQYLTSEGDRAHVFAPKGKINKKKIAEYIDSSDGIIGEEDVWEITNGKKKVLLTDKGRPDRVVKKGKKLRIFPQINIPFVSVNKKVSKRKRKTKKDPIANVLSFSFFK